MAYNKARAEKEWLEWKNDEETKLRKLGVDEDTIQRLHAYDWEAFKADRRYRERNDESDDKGGEGWKQKNGPPFFHVFLQKAPLLYPEFFFMT